MPGATAPAPAFTSTPTLTSRSVCSLGCSGRKHALPDLLPALGRYDGVNYRVLQRGDDSIGDPAGSTSLMWTICGQIDDVWTNGRQTCDVRNHWPLDVRAASG